MTNKEAAEILKYHQEWRKGADIPQINNVKELSKAIDKAIEALSGSTDNLEAKYAILEEQLDNSIKYARELSKENKRLKENQTSEITLENEFVLKAMNAMLKEWRHDIPKDKETALFKKIACSANVMAYYMMGANNDFND